MSDLGHTKLRLTIGQLSLDYEGNESFSKDDILDFLGQLSRVHANTPSLTEAEDSRQSGSTSAPTALPSLSVDSIAARLDANSGPELVVAAVAKLALIDGQQSIPRSEILQAMQTASTYYKKTMGSNLTASLRSLVSKKRLNEIATGHYSLSASERSRIEAAIDH